MIFAHCMQPLCAGTNRSIADAMDYLRKQPIEAIGNESLLGGYNEYRVGAVTIKRIQSGLHGAPGHCFFGIDYWQLMIGERIVARFEGAGAYLRALRWLALKTKRGVNR